MDRVRTTDAEVLAYQTGSWRDGTSAVLLISFGLLFFALALGISRDHAVIVGLLGLIGMGLAGVGAVRLILSLGRSGITLDRGRGKVVTWRGVVFRLSSRYRDLDAFDTVLLSPVRVRQRHAAGIVFQVGLQGPSGEPLACYRSADYQAARRFAVELAAFLHLPVTDASGTEAIVRTLGEPSHTLPPLARPLALGPKPEALECRVTWNGPLLEIEEPLVPRKRLIGLPLALFLVFALPCLGYGTYLQFFEPLPVANASPLVASIVVVLLLFLFFAGVVIVSLPHLYQRQVVEADSQTLRFKTVRPFSTRDTSIASADVTELRVAFGHLIVVTPRELRVVCGRLDHPLPRPELEWLRAQMWLAIKGNK